MDVGRFVAVFGSNLCWRVQLAWSVLNMGKTPQVSKTAEGKPQRKDKKEKRSQKDTKKTSKKVRRAVTSMDSDSGSSRSRERMPPPCPASRPAAR